MKLFRRYPRHDTSALRARAENVTAANILLHEMRTSGKLSDADYNVLQRSIQSEMDAVARELRA